MVLDILRSLIMNAKTFTAAVLKTGFVGIHLENKQLFLPVKYLEVKDNRVDITLGFAAPPLGSVITVEFTDTIKATTWNHFDNLSRREPLPIRLVMP